MKKYEKVLREDYEAWYRDNRDYRERVRADESRLAYHLMPETGWMNDPNGLCQFQGLYHIYYQYTPFEPTGEIKLWGHYTTRDFIHYKQEEPALFPDPGPGCPWRIFRFCLCGRIRPSIIFTQAM